MKILFVITRAEPLGGAQIHVRDLALALSSCGHDVHVLVGNDGEIVRQLVDAGASVHILKHLTREIRPLNDVRAFLELRRIIQTVKPDLVSSHSSKAGWISRLVRQSTGIPTLFTAHGFAFSEGVPRFRRQIYLFAEKVMASFSDIVVVVSEYDRDIAIRENVLRPDKLVVVRNGMPDLGSDVVADPAGDPPTLVMVARFMPQKDHISVLRALSSIKHHPWKLEFVGDGPLEEDVRQLADELDLSNRVLFLGRRLDVDRILSRAQIFVLISHWEGLSRSTIEALRAGLPSVVSNVGGMNELISDDVEGYLIHRNDTARLTEKLKVMIECPELRIQLGSAARRRYEREFRFNDMFDRTLKVYESLIGHSRATAP